MFEGWIDGAPPREWDRILAWDVGGASPHALEWSAIDTEGYIVTYDEVYKATTDMSLIADMSLPKMKDPSGVEYNFRFKVVDYENKIAAEDMRRLGITFTNAIKHGKAASIQRFSGYMHPNAKRPFPSWHPRAGQLGSPLWFVTRKCPNLIREIPLQRWKEGVGGDNLKDEPDRNVSNHGTDCMLYTVRPLPHPSEIKIVHKIQANSRLNLQSALYWEDVRRQKEKESNQEFRKPYRASHSGGAKPWIVGQE